ncbi:MAG: phosphatidate cytidylyltransferase [Woeseiaceae bacterium]
MIFGLPEKIAYALTGIFGLLVVASIATWALTRLKPGKDFTELVLRIKSWWVMAGIFSLAIMLDQKVSLFFLGFVSFIAFKEYLSLIPTRRADRRVLLLAYLSIPIQYFLIGIGWYGLFIIFIPVYMFLLIPMRMVTIGATDGFLKAAGTIHWGLMTTVFSVGHAAYLLVLPAEVNPGAGGAGLLLFLVFLTQFNDVAQFIWGKTIGHTKVVPTVSPGKTRGGLLGGMTTTIVLAAILGPWLTPMNLVHSIAAGVIIGLGGFLGDVTISAVKRDVGSKDSGQLLPGHGGILDRIDSLTFTAPLFFHFIQYLYY